MSRSKQIKHGEVVARLVAEPNTWIKVKTYSSRYSALAACRQIRVGLLPAYKGRAYRTQLRLEEEGWAVWALYTPDPTS